MTAGPGSLGVMLPRDLPAAAFGRYAARAEELGFDELWVVEDCFFRTGFTQAAVALAATTRIRVGLGIAPAAIRNAALTAMEISTLAELFPGRTEIGIGHGMPGWMRQVGAWPASPLTLLEEHLRAVRALLTGGTVSVDGRYVTLTDVRLDTPAQHVPPLLAGVRGPRSLALSGRLADGTILAEPVTPEYLAAATAQIAAEGEHRVVAYNVAAVDDDAAAARRAVRPGLAWIGDPDWQPHIAPLPFADDLARLRRTHPDRAAFAEALPDGWVDQLAVTGSPADARGRVEELWAAGASSVVLVPVAAAGTDPVEELESLARVVHDRASGALPLPAADR